MQSVVEQCNIAVYLHSRNPYLHICSVRLDIFTSDVKDKYKYTAVLNDCVINYLLYNKQIEERISFSPFILPRLTVIWPSADATVQSVVDLCNIALYFHSLISTSGGILLLHLCGGSHTFSEIKGRHWEPTNTTWQVVAWHGHCVVPLDNICTQPLGRLLQWLNKLITCQHNSLHKSSGLIHLNMNAAYTQKP